MSCTYAAYVTQTVIMETGRAPPAPVPIRGATAPSTCCDATRISAQVTQPGCRIHALGPYVDLNELCGAAVISQDGDR